MSNVNLPVVAQASASILSDLTKAFGAPRDILPSDEEISHAWGELRQLLNRIPKERLSHLHVRMCVAVSAGLFDSGVNYAWNSAILALRDNIREFGLNVVPQITSKSFDETTLTDLKDAELLSLCLSLNLITEDAHFFLDQCRDIRNNFSSAHPPMGNLDSYEFISYLNRVTKYALAQSNNPKGVDTQRFIAAIKFARFNLEQEATWAERVLQTHEAQRLLLILMLYGIYCDPASSEEARLNALSVCEKCNGSFTPKTSSELIERHSEYVAQGKTDRQTASQTFLRKLGLIAILNEPERHSLISKACASLMSVHQEFNNFYNEPPFAERLLDLSQQGAIPNTAQAEYVETVATCAIGNGYGFSNGAFPHYTKMIQNFSPREITIMLELPHKPTLLTNRISSYPSCRNTFVQLVKLIDVKSIPPQSVNQYKKITSAQ